MNVAEAPIDIGRLITRTPGIKNGSPHIAGTRVLVRTIARWYKLGMSAEEIAADYPQRSKIERIPCKSGGRLHNCIYVSKTPPYTP